VFGFLFTWTPYTVVFFISAFSKGGDNTPPMAMFICACFAKTSVIWIPILYMSTSTQFHFRLFDSSSADKSGVTVTAME
jgi:threonine/homoserine/homoserine lactone efflux protein